MRSFDDYVEEFEPGTILEINFDNFGKIVSTDKYDFKRVYQVESIDEREMTSDEKAKREKIVKALKKKMAGFKERYGSRAKDVMYATATKQAMKD